MFNMGFNETTIAFFALLITGVGVAVSVLWKLFTFTKHLEDKVSKQDFTLMEEELMEVKHKLDTLENSLNKKADDSSLLLLKQDVAYVKEQMITKTDLLQFEKNIIEALKKNN